MAEERAVFDIIGELQKIQGQIGNKQQEETEKEKELQNAPEKYVKACEKLLPEMEKEKSVYMEKIGNVLYEFVGQLVGPEKPKITGMIIDLPKEDL